jgi:hypothetical protein
MPERNEVDLVRLDLGSHINGFRRCRPAVKKVRMVDQQKGKGGTFVPPELSSTLKKPWVPPELSTLLMPWERELFSLDFERSLEISRSSHVFHYQSNPISDMQKEANGHPKRMRPASPLPTSPLPLNIFNPETPRKTRLERDQSKFLDIRVNLFEDEDAPFRPIVATTPITPITPIITTNLAFSPVQPQEYYSAPWDFTTPGTTPIITTDFSFSPDPQVYSPPEAFVTTPSTTTTAAPITPITSTTPSAPITPMITLTTTDNDEEQISTVASTSADKKTDKKIGKERKEPLRRSARIAAIKIKPNYKD